MRVRKVINRVYEGTVYYRWLVSVSPKQIRDLGWVDGQELSATIRGKGLWLEPALRPGPRSPDRGAQDLEEKIQRKSLLQR